MVSAKSVNATLSAQLAQQQAINDTNQRLLNRFRVTSYCFVPHPHTLIIARLLLLAGCGGNVDESSVAAAASLFSSSV